MADPFGKSIKVTVTGRIEDDITVYLNEIEGMDEDEIREYVLAGWGFVEAKDLEAEID